MTIRLTCKRLIVSLLGLAAFGKTSAWLASATSRGEADTMGSATGSSTE